MNLLAGVNNTPAAEQGLEQGRVLEREPELKKEGLVGTVGVYLDFRNNDARLCD